MVAINIGVQGVTEVSAYLEGVSKKLTDYSQPLQEATEYMQEEIQINFTEKGDRLGKRWKPRKKDYDWEILQRTGHMRDSFKDKQVGKGTSQIYNTAPYFVFHQSNQPRKKLPRRVMLRIGADQQSEIYRIFNKYVGKSIQ
jgi:phage gpG-like protein